MGQITEVLNHAKRDVNLHDFWTETTSLKLERISHAVEGRGGVRGGCGGKGGGDLGGRVGGGGITPNEKLPSLRGGV